MSPITGSFSITREDQLPEPGPLREGLHFDMKAIKGPGQRESELAKDVTAFANAEGGVLLIGAEQDGSTLLRYTPVEHSEALSIIEAYDKAVRKLCSPTPVYDAQDLKRDGLYVVALNVAAYPAPPIGVRTDDGTERWTFPVRRGDKTKHLEPEELATLMDGSYRRKALQLGRMIAKAGSGPIEVLIHFVDAANSRSSELSGALLGGAQIVTVPRFHITEVDSVGGAFTARENSGTRTVVVPIDALEGVWSDGFDKAHRIAISGLILLERNQYRYLPG